jgi:hypothetical protein
MNEFSFAGLTLVSQDQGIASVLGLVLIQYRSFSIGAKCIMNSMNSHSLFLVFAKFLWTRGISTTVFVFLMIRSKVNPLS